MELLQFYYSQVAWHDSIGQPQTVSHKVLDVLPHDQIRDLAEMSDLTFKKLVMEVYEEPIKRNQRACVDQWSKKGITSTRKFLERIAKRVLEKSKSVEAPSTGGTHAKSTHCGAAPRARSPFGLRNVNLLLVCSEEVVVSRVGLELSLTHSAGGGRNSSAGSVQTLDEGGLE
jgi:hypothetical protein